MLGSLRSSFRLPSPFGERSEPNSHAWSLDRNWDLAEGERHLKARNYPQAETHLAKAAVDAEVRKRPAVKRVQLRLLLAEAQRRQYRAHAEEPNYTKLDAAELTVRSAIEIAARTSESIAYLQCLDALAEIFADYGKYTAVEKVMQEAIKIEAELPHPDPIRMARRTLRLGIARHMTGRLDEAVPALEQAVALHEENFGPDHLETAHHLSELGAAYRAQGKHIEAQDVLRRALRIHQREGGIDAPTAVRDLHHLAGSLEESGDLEGAAEQYERALMFKTRTIGGSLEDFAELQYGLAGLYVTWQNYSRARELLSEALGIFRRKNDVRLAVTYETLAYVEECSGRYHDAVKELALAGKVWMQLPERTAELIRNMERRVELLDMIRRKGEAAVLREKINILQGLPVDAVHAT